jgi:hypothetical protein
MLISFIFLASATATAGDLSRPSVTPRTGNPDDSYVFLISYSDPENTPPENVYVVVNDKEHRLTPVDAADDNYTDGKDYTTKLKFGKGTHVYFFRAETGDGTVNSPAGTIWVREANIYTHMDVVYGLLVSTFIVLIPVLYTIFLLRKLVRVKQDSSQVNDRSDKKKPSKK